MLVVDYTGYMGKHRFENMVGQVIIVGEPKGLSHKARHRKVAKRTFPKQALAITSVIGSMLASTIGPTIQLMGINLG
jgi:hypothetical protein